MSKSSLQEIDLPETFLDGRRLGRHVAHDDRSWLYPAAMSAELRSIQHRRHYRTFNQGDIGMCTGVSAVELLMTEPFWRRDRPLDLDNARSIYAAASKIDDIRGVFPPDDVGSSGLAVMKVCKKRHYIREYRHAFGIEQALRALVLAPTVVGVNWYEGFDKPSRSGECKLAGGVRGGHEVVLDGIDIERKRVWGRQSWGSQWGDDGRFFWSFATYEQLLNENGDVTTAVPVRTKK
jgi:hypothetical protein